MFCKSTKYEQRQAKRFTGWYIKEREREEHLLLQNRLWNFFLPCSYALTVLLRELALIDKEVICEYMEEHKTIRNKEAEKMKVHKCEVCGKQTDEIYTVSKQIKREFKLLHVCPDCRDEHEALLESLRSNFRIQFGEK